MQRKKRSLFLIPLFQTKKDGIFNDFSNLEIKGSHRKLTDHSQSYHTEQKKLIVLESSL